MNAEQALRHLEGKHPTLEIEAELRSSILDKLRNDNFCAACIFEEEIKRNTPPFYNNLRDFAERGLGIHPFSAPP